MLKLLTYRLVSYRYSDQWGTHIASATEVRYLCEDGEPRFARLRGALTQQLALNWLLALRRYGV